jgi:hypothetical protein
MPGEKSVNFLTRRGVFYMTKMRNLTYETYMLV